MHYQHSLSIFHIREKIHQEANWSVKNRPNRRIWL